MAHMAEAPAPKVVEVDARGRLSIGRLVAPGLFLATVGADGSLLLEPAVVTTALEASLHANPELHRAITDRLDRLEEATPVTPDRRRSRTSQSA